MKKVLIALTVIFLIFSAMALKSSMKMKDGSMMKDGKMMMKNGYCVDMNGKVIKGMKMDGMKM
jgi:hypothetical protein